MAKLTDRLLYTLVAVILIIVIGGLIIPNIIGRAPVTYVKAAESQIARLAMAVETFHVDMKRPPQSLDELANSHRESNGKTRPYIKRAILNDPWGNPFVYVISDDRDSFVIISLGADGQEGGEGVNSDFRLKKALPTN